MDIIKAIGGGGGPGKIPGFLCVSICLNSWLGGPGIFYRIQKY